MEVTEPLVSVLMTAYNREKYIAEAIESVLDSTYTNFELIIVDDGSTDDTVLIAQKYLEKDRRIRLYVNEKKLNQFPNRNRAISYAIGEYIVTVDSDDTIFANGISNIVKTMLQFPSSSFGMYFANEKKDSFLLSGKEAIRKHFFEAPFLIMGPGATIIRRSFLLSINMYPVKYEAAGDMYFNLKGCSYSSIVLIPYQFMNYRRHSEQEVNNHYSYIYNNYLYFNDALNELPHGLELNQKEWLLKKNERRLLVNVCRYFLKTCNLQKTVHLFKLTSFKYQNFLRAIFQK